MDVPVDHVLLVDVGQCMAQLPEYAKYLQGGERPFAKGLPVVGVLRTLLLKEYNSILYLFAIEQLVVLLYCQQIGVVQLLQLFH